jgi:hypothetical protein
MLLILVMPAAAGSSKTFTAEGKIVPKKDDLIKAGGPIPRDWQGRHLTIKYEYICKQDDFQIMGDIIFKRDMQLPPGAQSMAFSYSGTSRGTGQNGSPNSFWSAPWS